MKDLAEIPDEIKNRLEIRPVRWIEQVLEAALERQPTPLAEAATEAMRRPPAPAADDKPPDQALSGARRCRARQRRRPARCAMFSHATNAADRDVRVASRFPCRTSANAIARCEMRARSA